MKNISVIHLVPALFQKIGGVLGGGERYAFELARHMANTVPTRLVTFGPKDDAYQAGPLEVRVLRPWWCPRGQATNPVSPMVLGLLSRAKVIHCHQKHVLSTTLAGAVGRLFGKRVFVTDLGGGGWDVSSYVSTDALFHGELHISEYSRSLSANRTRIPSSVILGGVDSEKFSPDRNVLRKNKFLFVGRILAHKGIDVLIEALTPEMTLEIIGQPYDPIFLSDLRELARGKNVVFRHDVNDESLVNAYRSARAIILPSVYKDRYGRETRVPELLGQTLLEGMACGAPAICTEVASLPEIVRHEIDGFVVPPRDPLALRERLSHFLAAPEKAAQMGESARRRAIETFNWSAVVSRCLQNYAICNESWVASPLHPSH